ncbi:unnamed protein product [Symbiodinium natans]|uniref:Uncharacterized protein n=1 Tax=Symbiodinium natans TaxID=878477 RepID=A0A812PT45_9DINO|nr:unnamed protein product [Symbiodinium natans]
MSSQPLAVQGFVSFEQGRANLTLVPSTTTPTASSHNASFPCDAKEDLQDQSGKRDLRDHIMAQIRSGTITPHPSRMPLSARTLASQIAHAQVKTHIQPTGVYGAWNPEAEQKLIATLTRSLRYQKPQAIEDKKPDGKPQAIEDKKDENEEKHHAPAIENGAPTVVDSAPSAHEKDHNIPNQKANIAVDLLLHDDACHFEQYVKKNHPDVFSDIKYYVVDAFHAPNHKCSKRYWTGAVKRRCQNVRTNIPEIFNAWIRSLNFFFNSLRPHSHKFWVAEACRFYNENLKDVAVHIGRRTNVVARQRRGKAHKKPAAARKKPSAACRFKAHKKPAAARKKPSAARRQ